jgi:hypothetical protein
MEQTEQNLKDEQVPLIPLPEEEVAEGQPVTVGLQERVTELDEKKEEVVEEKKEDAATVEEQKAKTLLGEIEDQLKSEPN